MWAPFCDIYDKRNRCSTCIHTDEEQSTECYSCAKGINDNYECKETVKCCDTCYWAYDGYCISESIELISGDESFGKPNCIGYLREDHEEYIRTLYQDVVELASRRNSKELEDILLFIKQQRD